MRPHQLMHGEVQGKGCSISGSRLKTNLDVRREEIPSGGQAVGQLVRIEMHPGGL